MENSIHKILEKKGVDFIDVENPIAVFLKKGVWIPYTNQESSTAVEILCEYYNHLSSLEEKEQEEETIIVEQKFEFKLPQVIVEQPISIQKQIEETIANLNLQHLMKTILSFNEIVRVAKIINRINLEFLKKKYGNASFSKEEWENIFSKENIHVG